MERQSHPRTMRLILALTLPLAFAGLGAQAANPYASARDSFDQYRAEQAAAQRAMNQGAAATAHEHQITADSRLRQATRLYEQAGAAKSEDPAVLLEYTHVITAAGNHDLAAEILANATQIAPGNPALWTALGRSYSKAGPAFHEKAFAALNKAVKASPTPKEAAEARLLLGDIYRHQGLFDFAEAEYRASLEANPDDVKTTIYLAVLKVRRGEILEGSKDLDSLGKAAQPHDIDTRLRLRAAIAAYEARRGWFPDTAENHAAYARLLYHAARWPDAVLAARRATRINPQDARTWSFIGAIQMQLGNVEQARKAYQRSLEANPDQPSVRQVLKKMEQAEKQPSS